MASLRDSPVDSPESHELLAEYFGSRELGFAHQDIVYTAVFPRVETFSAPDGAFVLVMDDEQVPVGCGGIRRIPDGSTGVRYEVKHLYLRAETRGRGWGRLLLGGLEDRARVWGAKELVLDTHHTLEAAAGLYRASGFEPIARFNDNPNATVWLGKAL